MVREIIARWKSVFTDETTKVGVTDYVDPFSIELEPGTKPVRQRTRHLTPVQVETLKQQLADWTVVGSTYGTYISSAFPHFSTRQRQCVLPVYYTFIALHLKIIF